MSYQPTLDTDIDKLIAAKMAAGEPLQAKLIAQQICEANKSALRKGSKKADFWRHSGYRTARSAVTKRINLITALAPSADARQPTLPGFEHLYSYYTVSRDGEDIGLPIGALTEIELRRIEHRLDAMAVTCKAHSREVQRFRLAQFGQTEDRGAA